MRLILAFINFILSIFIGNFGTAAKEFFDALIDFMGNIIDTIFNLLIMFVDTVIFGGLKIEGDYGPIECLIHIGACIAGIFGFRDAVEYAFKQRPRKVALAGVKIPGVELFESQQMMSR